MLFNICHRFRIVAALLFLVAVNLGEAAEINTEKIQKDVIGSWIVTIDSVPRMITLNIDSAETGPEGILVLNSTYGWTDGAQTPVNAKLISKAGSNRLLVTTQAKNVLSAEYTNNIQMNGTFTWTSGKVMPVTLEKLSSDEIGKRVAIQREVLIKSTIKPAATDVPASCAGFVGGWSGYWPGYGRKWLWVAEVDANCVGKYAVEVTSAFPYRFQRIEIKGGVLERLKSDGGTEYYELHGEELRARYAAPPGSNSNTTVYKKLQPGDK